MDVQPNLSIPIIFELFFDKGDCLINSYIRVMLLRHYVDYVTDNETYNSPYTSSLMSSELIILKNN